MIRFSALLVALAIGLLAAGVAASSLPLVYVSIAVCAVAALLLAAGVLRHWSEIFGPRTQRVASPFAASGPVPSPATAGRAAAAPGRAGSRRHSGPGRAGGRSGSGRLPGRRRGSPSGPGAGTGRRGRPVPGRRRSGWPRRPGPSRSGRPRGQRGPGGQRPGGRPGRGGQRRPRRPAVRAQGLASPAPGRARASACPGRAHPRRRHRRPVGPGQRGTGVGRQARLGPAVLAGRRLLDPVRDVAAGRAAGAGDVRRARPAR